MQGEGEYLSLYLFPNETGVEYHAQNREIKRGIAPYFKE